MEGIFSIVTEKFSTTGKLFKMNSEQLFTPNEVINHLQSNDFIILENNLDTSIFRTKDIITISWQTKKSIGG